MPFESGIAGSPLAAFTLIAAPAVLTNAASVLAMSTSNRFARSVERARHLASRISAANEGNIDEAELKLRVGQFNRAYRRTLLLVRALSCTYFSLGANAMSCLIALVGAALEPVLGERTALASVAPIVSLAALALGVGGLALGCLHLVLESRLAVVSTAEERELIRQRFPKLMAAAQNREAEQDLKNMPGGSV